MSKAWSPWTGFDSWHGDPGRNNPWWIVHRLANSQAKLWAYWPVEAPPRLPVDGFRIGGETLTSADGGWWIEGMIRLIQAIEDAEDLPPRKKRTPEQMEAVRARRLEAIAREIERLQAATLRLRGRSNREVH